MTVGLTIDIACSHDRQSPDLIRGNADVAYFRIDTLT